MQVYTVTKSQYPDSVGNYIYNFEQLPQENLYIKICSLFLPSDTKAIKRGNEILQDEQAQINIETDKYGWFANSYYDDDG